jgi:hypothetical protein
MSICCKRSSLKWAAPDRHQIFSKQSPASSEALLFETSRQIVAFDEMIASHELIVIERGDLAGPRLQLFESDDPYFCLSILDELDAQTGEFRCLLARSNCIARISRQSKKFPMS